MIGSLHAICYVIGARSRGCPTSGIQFEPFCNWIPVIGYPLDSHVKYTRSNGFLYNVYYSFQNLSKVLYVHPRFCLNEVLKRHF